LFLWEDTLKKLENDPFQLVGRLDAITKHALYLCFDERFPAFSEESFWQMRGVDMDYHDLDPNKSFFQAMRSKGIIEDLYAKKLFSWYMQNPPPETRAHFRGNLAKMLNKSSRNLRVLSGNAWNNCTPFPSTYNIYPGLKDTVLSIEDPFDSYQGRLLDIEAAFIK
jgi:hypothetical protein